MLDIDSPGGEVSGCFDLVDTIAAARGQKPIWSIVDDCACSAAYAIASAADRIILPRDGQGRLDRRHLDARRLVPRPQPGRHCRDLRHPW